MPEVEASSPAYMKYINLVKTLALAHLLAIAPIALAQGPSILAVPQSYGSREGGIFPAPPEEAKMMKDAIVYLAEEAEKNGAPNEIDWFRLDVYKQEIQDLNIWYNDSSFALVGSGGRIGGLNLPSIKTVIFNTSLIVDLTRDGGNLKPLNSGNETTLLHESLKALGYPDENYEISTYLWARTFSSNYSPELFAIIEGTVKQHLSTHPRSFVNFSIGGTSTGLGGGGDPASAAVKLFAFVTLAQFKEVFMRDVPLTQLEYEELVRSVVLLKIEPDSVNNAYSTPSQAPSGPTVVVRRGSDQQLTAIVNTQRVRAAQSGDIKWIALELLQGVREALRSETP